MSKRDPHLNGSNNKASLAALESEILLLRQENEKLKQQTESVAMANAHAVELMAELDELNTHLNIEIIKRKEQESRSKALTHLQMELMESGSLEHKIKLVTDALISMVNVDFARIWLINQGDRCTDCFHAHTPDEQHCCLDRSRCLHLVASSGRYTHIDGDHARVPFGCYKIGQIASGKEDYFLTNAATTDARVHNHQWAAELGLVSFVGYKLVNMKNETIGVMAMFSRHPIDSLTNDYLLNISHSISQVIISKQAQVEREKYVHDLGKRIKEVSCIYGIVESVGQCETLDDVFRKTVTLIPPGWQYPEIARAKIGYDDKEYLSQPFEETEWKQSSDIIIQNERRGAIEIYYLEKHPIEDEGPFLSEERQLIDNIARSLGQAIEQLLAKSSLEKAKVEMEHANRQLQASTKHANQLAQEADLANQAKSEFLANMSHEIRTPMNGIIGMLDLAFEEPLNDTVYSLLATCKSSTNELMNIINDILDISKIEAGKIDIEITDCSFNKMLLDIQSLMESRATDKNLEFSIIFDTPVPDQIRTDITRVRQCLLNIIGNAIKFTDTGFVHLHVSADKYKNSPALRFVTEDTGIGMTWEQQRHIFDKFSQADSSITRKFGGTGLGMSITKQLTELLGGSISLTSEKEKGTTFSMIMPIGTDMASQSLLSDLDRNRPIKKEKSHQAILSGNILMAEDNEVNQKVVRLMLDKTDLHVTIVDDGCKAVEAASSGDYDLILMDMHMPNMGGLEATRTLRQNGFTQPIIALTADVMKDHVTKILEAGCDAHLSKPVNRKELFSMLNTYLSSERTPMTDNNDPKQAKHDESTPSHCSPNISQTDSFLPTGDDVVEIPIDWFVLLENIEDEGVIISVVDALPGNIRDTLQKLSDATKIKASSEVELHAHSLKGVSTMLGAHRLHAKTHQLECAGKQNNTAIFDPLFDEIQQGFDDVMAFLSQPDWVEVAKEHDRNKQKAEIPIDARIKELSTRNKQLLQEIIEWKRSEKLLDGLNRLKEKLLHAGKLKEKLKQITDSVYTLFEADFVRIWVLQPGDLCYTGCMHARVKKGPHVCRHRDRCLHLMTSSGRYTHIDGEVHRRVPFGCYKIGRVAAGEILSFVTNDVAHDDRVHNRQWARELGLVSFAGYRLLSDSGIPMGVLALFSKQAISPKENALLENLASTTTQVIQVANAEESLRLAKEQAENANRVKGDFLANMSHELRTPMNAIIGFSEMLAGGQLTADQRRDVDVIRDSSHTLLSLINDILDFSKIEAGNLTVERIECSLAQIVDSIEFMMMPKAEEKGITFAMLTDGDLPASINTDPTRLSQCLINLTSNAVKFTEEGHVHVNVSLEVTADESSIRFDVEDTGIGIPQDKQRSIFSAFTQVESSMSCRYGGTGLGLAITEQLAGLLGGNLTVTSKEGEGSVFSLVIPTGVDVGNQPLLDSQQTVDHNPQETSETRSVDTLSGSLLVAEDVEANQILIESLLTKMGLDVTLVEDGEEAVKLVLSHSFDLILMDIHMPKMNGYEATQAIRQQGHSTPIVALTANAIKGDDQKCMDAGCNDYLAKPINRKQLHKILLKYLPTKHIVLDQASNTNRSELHTSRTET